MVKIMIRMLGQLAKNWGSPVNFLSHAARRGRSFSKILESYWEYAPDPTMPEPDPAYQLRIFYTVRAPPGASKRAPSPFSLVNRFCVLV